MPVKKLFQEEGSGSNQLPLVRQYCKNEIVKGNEPYDNPLEIRKVAISKNEEWVVVETDVCVALIPSESKLGQSFLGVIADLKEEGHMLVLIPERGGKLGFSVGIDEDNKAWYNYHKEEKYLNVARSKPKKVVDKPLFTLDDIITRPPDNPLTAKASSQGGVKPGNGRRANRSVKAPTTV